jgi:hypothetical protein
VTDLEPGDKVRIDDTALFKKGTESRWSDQAQSAQAPEQTPVLLTISIN